MTETAPRIDDIVLAALFAADRPLQLEELGAMFELGDNVPRPAEKELEAALGRVSARLEGLPVEVKKLAGGYRLEVPPAYSTWVSRLWVERPARYSRALLETLALIAYRQPVTRPEIEAVRGVEVNTNIVRALSERGWIRIVGHRDTPGRPALYGTTRVFLDYFGLASLDELPTLADVRELADYEPELPLDEDGTVPVDRVSPAEGGMSVGDTAPESAAESRGVVQGPWSPDGGGG